MNTVANLTPEQSQEWKSYVQWYSTNGWEGEEGRRLAWIDLVRKYPDLTGQAPPPKSEE